GAALLQDLQQPPPAQRGEAVPAAGDRLALDVDVDVVPAGELALHRAVDLRVGVLDAAQGLVREHDAEAERVVGRVPFPDRDLAAGAELLGERREVQPARPAAHDRDPHPASLPGPTPQYAVSSTTVKTTRHQCDPRREGGAAAFKDTARLPIEPV